MKTIRDEWKFVTHPSPHDKTEWVSVTCRIRNNATGEIREHPDECVWEDDDGWGNCGPSTFWWSDGNAGCDCNRSTWFHGSEPCDESCGDNRYSVELVNPKTGKVFYSELAESA